MDEGRSPREMQKALLNLYHQPGMKAMLIQLKSVAPGALVQEGNVDAVDREVEGGHTNRDESTESDRLVPQPSILGCF